MDKVDVRGGPEIGTVDVSAREDRHLLNADAAAGLLALVDHHGADGRHGPGVARVGHHAHEDVAGRGGSQS